MPSHYQWQTSTEVLKKSTDGNSLCPTEKASCNQLAFFCLHCFEAIAFLRLAGEHAFLGQ